MVSAGVAVVLMLSNVNDHIGAILTFQGVSMFAWTASMIVDLLIVKKLLKIGPSHIEYRRGELSDWNPVGPIALLIGSVVGAYFALFNPGTVSAATSAFMAGGIAFVIHIILAIITQGKYYYVNQGKVLERESSTKI